jgi:hypothetical protein
MNSVKATIGKNLVLLTILTASVLNFFFHWLTWKELLAVQCLAGLAYIFLSCFEYLNASYKAALPIRRFPYFTYSFFMFRLAKTALFLSLAAMLYLSGHRVKSLYPICLIIATTEGVITYLRYRNGLCFVNIYANYLLLVQNEMNRVFAQELMFVEFRHEIFYFVKNNRKTIRIRLDHIGEKDAFLRGIYDWISRNNVLISDESRGMMKELIES